MVFYEAPHRIRHLEDMQAIVGERVVSIGRELTKAQKIGRSTNFWSALDLNLAESYGRGLRPDRESHGRADAPMQTIVDLNLVN